MPTLNKKDITFYNVPVSQVVEKVKAFKALFDTTPLIAVKGVFQDKEGDLAFCTNHFYHVAYTEKARKWLTIFLEIEKCDMTPENSIIDELRLSFIPSNLSSLE